MGDSSSFTRRKLASAVTGGYLALRQMGGSKPNSTFAAVQHTSHRPTPPANKSYYNRTTTPTPTPSTPPSVQTQINGLTFNTPSDFTALNTLLRTATSEVISTTNPTLITYYNNLLPSLNIPAGTTFYILAGTNITASMLSSLPANSFILMPDGYDITIDGKTVSVTSQRVVVDNIQYNSGDPIQITNNTPTLDFLIAGSPALLQLATNYSLDILPFPTTDFDNTARYFLLDTDNTRDSSNDTYWGVTLSKLNYPPNLSTNPQFTSNLTCNGLVSFGFTPTIRNKLKSKTVINILLGTKDQPLVNSFGGSPLTRILYVDFIDSNGLRISGNFPSTIDDMDGVYKYGSFIGLGTAQTPVSGELIAGQKYYLVVKYKLPTTLFLMNMQTD